MKKQGGEGQKNQNGTLCQRNMETEVVHVVSIFGLVITWGDPVSVEISWGFPLTQNLVKTILFGDKSCSTLSSQSGNCSSINEAGQ